MAGMPRTDSVIADSTVSSSSPCQSKPANTSEQDASTSVEPPRQAKRAGRTYGRPKIDASSREVTDGDPGSRARVFKTAPRHADDQVVPESDDMGDRVPTFHGFAWRAKLKEIDEDYDDCGEVAATGSAKNVSAMPHDDASDTHQNAGESMHFTASPLSHLSHLSLDGFNHHVAKITSYTAAGVDSLFPGSQCTLLASGQQSDSCFSGNKDLLSNEDSGSIPKGCDPLHPDVPKSPKASDSENASPRHPYAINSPEHRTSPTPPTSPLAGESISNEASVSEDDPANNVAKRDEASNLQKRCKGKQKRKAKSSGKRIKHLTKKDMLEIQKESARLLADQHVSIPRNEIRPVHTIANLFNKFISTPTLVKQESDPITSFSSPGHPFKRHHDMTSSTAASPVSADYLTAVNKSSMPKTMQHMSPLKNAERLVDDNADEDMPDPADLLRDHDRKRQLLSHKQLRVAEAGRRAKELESHKRKALELHKTRYDSKVTSSGAGDRTRMDSDGDDDLEIVEDMVSVHPHGHVGKSAKLLAHAPYSTFSGVGAGKQIGSRSKVVSQKSLEFSARPTFSAAQDERGSRRKAGQGITVSHQDLNNLMLQRADAQSSAIEEEKKVKWVMARGGSPGPHSSNATERSATEWLHKGLTREDAMELDDESDDEDVDLECTPEKVQDCCMDGSDNKESEPRTSDAEGTAEQKMYGSEDEPNTDTDKENHRPVLRKQSMRVIVDSDEENDFPDYEVHSPAPVVLALNTSFTEDVEDPLGEDKENSAELAFDQGEDKENAKVPRHLPRGRVLTPNETPSAPDLGFDDDIRADREPLSSLDSEGGSPFAQSFSQIRDSSQGRVLRVLHEEDIHSTFSPVTTRKGFPPQKKPLFFSPGLVDEQVESPRNFLGGRFSEFFVNNDGVDAEDCAPKTAVGEGSFSQFFSPEDESPSIAKDQNHSVPDPKPTADDDFQFTQPSALLPSVRISESQRREVDEMFGKDQEFKLEEAKRMWEVKSTETSPLDSRSRPSQFSPSLPHSTRRPLETLQLESSDSDTHLNASSEDLHLPRGRLLRGRPPKLQENPSPRPARRNAFDVLREAVAKDSSRSRVPKSRFQKSEFVESEAQESDEEAMLGFGGGKEDDDEVDEDPAAMVQGLVDDTVMDASVQAADLVLEKHMENQAADDAAIEKLHQDIVAGKYRGRRRDRGLVFQDSDSEDEYESSRKPLNKKRRIDGDTLESYGQNPQTKAFYDAYQAELAEDSDPSFAHLQQKDSSPREESGHNTRRPATINSSEVQQRFMGLPSDEDFQDISWLSNEDEAVINDFRVEERPFCFKKPAKGSDASFDQLDYRNTLKGQKTDTVEQVQLKNWASQEARTQSSASGRGGFSRKDEGSKGSSRRRCGFMTASKVSVTGENTRATATKSSSLVSQIEKRKGFDS